MEKKKKKKVSAKKKQHVAKISKKKKVIRTLTIAVGCIAAFFLLVVIVAYCVLQHYIGLTDYVDDKDVTTIAIEDLPTENEGTEEFYVRETVTDSAGNVVGTTYETIDLDKLSDEEKESISASVQQELSSAQVQQSQAASIPMASSDHVYNLLLIGVDVRAGANWNGNSDSMILVSINTEKKKIYLTSFMRDLYANIPGVGTYKLNRAHAVGGGPLLIQTIESNYRISIDNYARVNFYSLISIIDSIGGVDMTLSADEVKYANMYIREMATGAGQDPAAYYLQGSGSMHLNGMQATAYARIRYAGNADYERTERQRRVLMQIFSKLQTRSVSEINAFLTTALPLVTHNLPDGTITTLLLNAPTYLTYSIESSRIPYDGMFGHVGEMLLPDFEATINRLHSTIY